MGKYQQDQNTIIGCTCPVLHLKKYKTYETNSIALPYKKNFLKDKNINFTDLKLVEKSISFNVESKDAKNVEEFFLDKESEINPYYNQYKSHQFDFVSKFLNKEILFQFERIDKGFENTL